MLMNYLYLSCPPTINQVSNLLTYLRPITEQLMRKDEKERSLQWSAMHATERTSQSPQTHQHLT